MGQKKQTYQQNAAAEQVRAELLQIKAMVEDGILGLQPAVAAFSHLYNEQELKKLNIMRLASTIETDGRKIKTIDFVSEFDQILANAVGKILDTAKNSMKTACLLNMAIDEIDVMQAMLQDPGYEKKPKDLSNAIIQLSIDLKKSQNTLKTLVAQDIDESMRVQGQLDKLLASFTHRNDELRQMIDSPPMASKQLEDAVIGIIDQMKNAQLLKLRINKLLDKINGE